MAGAFSRLDVNKGIESYEGNGGKWETMEAWEEEESDRGEICQVRSRGRSEYGGGKGGERNDMERGEGDNGQRKQG